MSRSKREENRAVADSADALITDLDVRVSDLESAKIAGGFFKSVGGLTIDMEVVSKPPTSAARIL